MLRAGRAAWARSLLADVRRENGSQFRHLRLSASGIETQRFHRLRNRSTAVGHREQSLVDTTLGFPF